MNNNTTCPSIVGSLEAIEQTLNLCELLDNNSYTFKALPYVQSSIGEHLRHILDMFFALTREPSVGVVDYDHRRRGAPVESNLEVGVDELNQVKKWLERLDSTILDKPVVILSEATISTQKVCEMASSLRRELLFVASHTIHHLAIIKVITTHCNIETSEHLGYAPATATYLRGQA